MYEPSNNDKQLHGIIGINQLRLSGIIGILPFERHIEQDVLIDIKLKKDLKSCLHTGNLDESIDYVILAELCRCIMQEQKCLLLETLATQILMTSMERFNALWGWIRVSKPAALPNAQAAYVEFEQQCLISCGH